MLVLSVRAPRGPPGRNRGRPVFLAGPPESPPGCPAGCWGPFVPADPVEPRWRPAAFLAGAAGPVAPGRVPVAGTPIAVERKSLGPVHTSVRGSPLRAAERPQPRTWAAPPGSLEGEAPILDSPAGAAPLEPLRPLRHSVAYWPVEGWNYHMPPPPRASLWRPPSSQRVRPSSIDVRPCRRSLSSARPRSSRSGGARYLPARARASAFPKAWLTGERT